MFYDLRYNNACFLCRRKNDDSNENYLLYFISDSYTLFIIIGFFIF